MSPEATSDPTQFLTLRAFTVLHQLRPAWAGSLVISLGLNRGAAALSVASSIAGAVSLFIDNDPVRHREATRAAAVDFTVNTLDEALRAIKNEVRKHTPLSVALTADPIQTLDEILERGLAPQLFSTFLPPHPRVAQAAATLTSLGGVVIDFSESSQAQPEFPSMQSILAPLLEARGWDAYTFPFDTPALLGHFDREALALLLPEDSLRRRWLEAVPRILRRQRPPHRTLWLTTGEYDSLRSTSV